MSPPLHSPSPQRLTGAPPPPMGDLAPWIYGLPSWTLYFDVEGWLPKLIVVPMPPLTLARAGQLVHSPLYSRPHVESNSRSSLMPGCAQTLQPIGVTWPPPSSLAPSQRWGIWRRRPWARPWWVPPPSCTCMTFVFIASMAVTRFCGRVYGAIAFLAYVYWLIIPCDAMGF
jgi:hypothetical protein